MTTKKKNKSSKRLKKKGSYGYNKKSLERQVLDILALNPTQSFNYKQIAKRTGIKDPASKHAISSILHSLTSKGQLQEMSRGKFQMKEQTAYVTGKIDATARGKAKLVSDELAEPIHISTANLKNALHGDEVKVYVYAKRKKRGPEGEVMQIIKRNRLTYVGVVQQAKSYAFLVIDDRNISFDIFIPPGQLGSAKNGEKAVAKILEWPEKSKNPVGEIVEVLGMPGEHETEIHAIMADFELPIQFPQNVEQAANRISAEITPEEISKRRDFRETTAFTIDPVDAKDFDDALSIRPLGENRWEVGVHIADVTHYVRPNTVLDKEALERGTSVYLVDRVVPMLPERLSNQICSLRPHEEKLCYSAVFEMDEHANVLKQWVGRTVIKSDRRFTYEEAQQVIETGEGDFNTEILTLNKLALVLRDRRYKNGAISFDRVEVRFHLDEDNRPTGVYFKESKEANHLIEEFMLLANKKVAELIGQPTDGAKSKTFVYRVHDEPDSQKLHDFSRFVKQFGYHLKTKNKKEITTSLNKLLTDVEGKKEQNVVEQLAIRSMAKAEYSVKNIGHYGLAFKHYTHFTSPIRRYPDVMVHRLLEHYANDGSSVTRIKYEKMCKHSSDRERVAAMAERASVKYKQVEFMQDKLGQVFEGVISGVTEWGLYVELDETKIEGMVSLKDMDDDYYTFDEKNFSIIGQYSKNNYRLGDRIKIQVIRTNLQKKQLDFMLAQ